MNLAMETTQETYLLEVSPLMCLFELKGYECEEMKRTSDTVYVFKADRHPHVEYTKEKNPNWNVIRTHSPGMDWL